MAFICASYTQQTAPIPTANAKQFKTMTNSSSSSDGASNKGSTSIEKMTEGFILSSATNNTSNNNSNDITSTSSTATASIDTPRSVTSSPEEGDDSKIVGVVDGNLEVGDADSTSRGDNREVTTLGK